MELRELARPAEVVSRLTPIAAVARRMADTGARAVVVVDSDRLWGIVTDRDLVVRALARDFRADLPIGWVATPDPVWVDAHDTVVNGYARLRETGLRQVPVMADGACVGLLRLDDLLDEIPVELLGHPMVRP